MSNSIVPNIDNVAVSLNEIVSLHVWNRNIAKLIENDQANSELYTSLLTKFGIVDNDPNKKYLVGQMIWYKTSNTSDGTPMIYTLKNLIPNNSGLLADEKPSSFRELGWNDENAYMDMLSYGITTVLSAKVHEVINTHSNDVDFHPLGKISLEADNDNYIGNKLLYRDLSNVDKNRDTNIYPDTLTIWSKGCIINGFYRVYNDSIVEYDLIFSFGTSEKQNTTSIFGSSSQISANTEIFKTDSTIGETYGKQDNRKYFYNTGNMNIFGMSTNLSSDKSYSLMGMMRLINRNDYVNTYAAKILFPNLLPFADRNYMIYSNMILSQANGSNVTPSANELTFCNKTTSTITILNITYPGLLSSNYAEEGYNASNSGLISNSFHCKIIGRLR